MPNEPSPATLATRLTLHRVAVHVLARARYAATGRFGLRATAGGFGTPAFGTPGDEEVLRVSGGSLLRERRVGDAMQTAVRPIGGSSLAELATFAEVDLGAELSVGRDTPDLGDVDAPLRLDPDAAEIAGEWFAAGAGALDRVLVATPAAATPTVVQLWPEHFDLAFDRAAGATRVNLGVSAGDHYHEAPYAYVGPWSDARPGDAAYWNVPFGALVGRDDVAASDAVAALAAFFRRGLDLLAAG